MHKILFFADSEPPQTLENIADELSTGRALSPFASCVRVRQKLPNGIWIIAICN